MYSIFHFWHQLVQKKEKFEKVRKLDKFPFPKEMLSCSNEGVFPDLAIKINTQGHFSGGELVELKDSSVYNISSFNSTIPTGKKNIRNIVTSETGNVFRQMQEAGDDVFSLEVRDVYYLVRGRKSGHQKICLVHGSFFETIPAEELVGETFSQVVDEELNDPDINDNVKKKLKGALSRQDIFSRVRSVDKASVSMRFRVLVEVKPDANILSPKHYPEILDDTLNLICPFYTEDEKEELISNVASVIGLDKLNKLGIFPIKHPLNGWFLVFQVKL
ncbi:MAG: hypothetical protein H6634_18670 [Anaerolineales bacterium]|nr:hypothetical protein [Anaerolineales bacterium]